MDDPDSVRIGEPAYPDDDTPAAQSALLHDTLSLAVELATDGAASTPRPGQLGLAEDATSALRGRERMAGRAPTGVGKTLGYGVPLAIAATRSERSIISTESLALQSQLIDKDLPVIVEATAGTTGSTPTFAVLKGWSNYGCVLSAVATLHTEMGTEAGHGSAFTEVTETLEAIDAFESSGMADPSTAERRSLARWVLEQTVEGQDADRHYAPGVVTESDWSTVSMSSTECVGVNECPFGELCRAAHARERAAAADIVVTNHSMVAIQAAKNVPVVVGNKTLGAFEHIVVDEAHALPGIVRGQGATSFHGARIFASVAALRKILDDTNPTVAKLLDDASVIAGLVDREIEDAYEAVGSTKKAREIEGDIDPIEVSAIRVDAWIDAAKKQCAAVKGRTAKIVVARRRAFARLQSLREDLDAVRTGIPGIARWLEPETSRGRRVIAAKASPVEIGWMLRDRVWVAPVPDDRMPELDPDDGSGRPDDVMVPDDPATRPTYALSVVAVSATLPGGFPYQIGIADPQVAEYESPFDSAYARSLLYIPRATSPEDVGALARPKGSANRRSLDTSRHTDWAERQIVDLVAHNGGSALILSATTKAGRAYAEALREAAWGRWTVHSQWDGASTRSLVDAWRSEESSVMVGTRSLMTGVDAPGETCSLVIVDRIPRAAFNPVDDARVALFQERLEMGRWEADQLVYVADAALLLEQAAGRLIRSTSDSGMVAILDPRLVKSGPWVMAGPARAVYMRALRRFEFKTASTDDAVRFLTDGVLPDNRVSVRRRGGSDRREQGAA